MLKINITNYENNDRITYDVYNDKDTTVEFIDEHAIIKTRSVLIYDNLLLIFSRYPFILFSERGFKGIKIRLNNDIKIFQMR